ncbi:hypothetical protein [Castellaniella sp.]|uniref:hypothetical protein n=1 Tax=Castellaniella sp. TaxID=1955812 RepID=UPI0035601B66
MLNPLDKRKVLILASAIFLLAIAFSLGRQMPDLLAARLANPDSYTRLVLVRDWQPATGYQYMARDAAPHGSYLHWAMVHTWTLQHLAQALQWLGLPQDKALLLAGAGITELSTLLLGLFSVLAILAQGGRLAAIATALALISARGLLAYAQPLQITHHIFMLVPLACAAWLLLRPRSRPFLAGLGLGLSLWISPETMPFIAGLAALQAGRRLQGAGGAACWPLALGLGLMLLLGWWIDPPPPTFDAWALDHLSLAWLAWAAIVAALLCLADILASRPRLPLAWKVGLIAAAALAGAALWLALAPGALAGPAGLLPDELKTLWWRHINELRPSRKASEILAWVAMPALAGGLLLHAAWRARILWWALLGLMATAYAALAAWHVRMGAAAALAAALAWGIWLTRQAVFISETPTALPARAQHRAAFWLLVPILLVVLSLGSVALERWLGDTPTSPSPCRLADIADELNAVPPATILVHLNQAPELLWRTHHRVIAGNYHHNTAGLLDTYHVWLSEGDDARARAIVAQRGIQYILQCADADAGTNAGTDAGGDTLARRLARGAPVSWARGPFPLGAWNLYIPGTAPVPPAIRAPAAQAPGQTAPQADPHAWRRSGSGPGSGRPAP